MSERLSHDELTELHSFANAFLPLKAWHMLDRLVEEVRERRAQDPSDDVVDYLVAVVEHSLVGIRERFGEDVSINPIAVEALRTLKLLGRRTKAGG